MLFVALASLLLIPSADAAPKPREWTVGDAKREAIVYVPAKADKPAPVIFAFHGHGARTLAYQSHSGKVRLASALHRARAQTQRLRARRQRMGESRGTHRH